MVVDFQAGIKMSHTLKRTIHGMMVCSGIGIAQFVWRREWDVNREHVIKTLQCQLRELAFIS